MTSQNSVYRPSTLVQRKGKWYVQVTKPKSLQFGQDRQARRSTGTSDRKQAALLQHQLTQEIYDSFDEALGQSDPFFEAVRSQLESEGFKAKDWYEKGYVERIRTNSVGTRLRKKLASHIDIIRHLRMIDTDQLNLLSEQERQAAIDLATPKPLDSSGLFEFSRREGMTLERYERVARSKIRQLYIKGSDITLSPAGRLSDVLEQFLRSRKPTQRKHDRTMVSAWIKGSFADKPLSEVDRHDAYEFLQEYGESHKKASVLCFGLLGCVQASETAETFSPYVVQRLEYPEQVCSSVANRTEELTREIYLDGVTDEDRSELALLEAATDRAQAQYRQVKYGSNATARANRFVDLQMAFWTTWPLEHALELERDRRNLQGDELEQEIIRYGISALGLCRLMVETLHVVIAKPVGT
jgi:hypothetical protein